MKDMPLPGLRPYQEEVIEWARQKARSLVDESPIDPEEARLHRIRMAAPDLLEALKEAKQVLEMAKRYFPKSIKNSDTFSLLNVLANSVNPAIANATKES